MFLSPSTGGGYIFAEYMKDAVSNVKQYDYEGKLVREIELPGIGTVGGFGGEKEEKELYYSFTNYVTPGSIYKYNVESRDFRIVQQAKGRFQSQTITRASRSFIPLKTAQRSQ